MNLKYTAVPLGFVVVTALFLGCSRSPSTPRPALTPTEATALQAPFVLRLIGPPPPTGATQLSLEAVLQVPPGVVEPLPILVEVQVPAGAISRSAARQVVSVGGAVRTVRLPLSFELAQPLVAPIVVRASLERGEALRAVAERTYPEPPPPATIDPAASGPSPLPGVPVGTPIETAR
jgi:hypothetical protein